MTKYIKNKNKKAIVRFFPSPNKYRNFFYLPINFMCLEDDIKTKGVENLQFFCKKSNMRNWFFKLDATKIEVWCWMQVNRVKRLNTGGAAAPEVKDVQFCSNFSLFFFPVSEWESDFIMEVNRFNPPGLGLWANTIRIID